MLMSDESGAPEEIVRSFPGRPEKKTVLFSQIIDYKHVGPEYTDWPLSCSQLLRGDGHTHVDAFAYLGVQRDVDARRHLQRYRKRIRHLLIQASGIGAAVHLNPNALAVHECVGPAPFENVVLDRASLGCLPMTVLAA